MVSVTKRVVRMDGTDEKFHELSAKAARKAGNLEQFDATPEGRWLRYLEAKKEKDNDAMWHNYEILLKEELIDALKREKPEILLKNLAEESKIEAHVIQQALKAKKKQREISKIKKISAFI